MANRCLTAARGSTAPTEQELGTRRWTRRTDRQGGNYGWPRCEGTVGRCSESWLVAPEKTYAVHLGWCSGITTVRDALDVACLRGPRLYRVPVSVAGKSDEQILHVGLQGSPG